MYLLNHVGHALEICFHDQHFGHALEICFHATLWRLTPTRLTPRIHLNHYAQVCLAFERCHRHDECAKTLEVIKRVGLTPSTLSYVSALRPRGNFQYRKAASAFPWKVCVRFSGKAQKSHCFSVCFSRAFLFLRFSLKTLVSGPGRSTPSSVSSATHLSASAGSFA